MKKLIPIVAFLCLFSCHAQTSIESLKGWGGIIPPNTYLKDMDNDFDSFEGVYMYENNGVVFRIKLLKKTMLSIDEHYEDMLIGEISYSVQNTTLVNTMGNIIEDFEDPYKHAIVAGMIIDNNDYLYCDDCSPNEIRISGSMSVGPLPADLMLRKTMVDQTPALKVNVYINHFFGYNSGEAIPSPIVPGGDYVMIKQP
jgi:hypothetical protein